MQSKPIFDKRLYKAQAGITISKEAKEVLLRNATKTRNDIDLHVIRSVVCGLKEIHKNFEFVKAALGCAVTYEEQESDTRVEKTEREVVLSCYYVLSGSVEATYKVKNGVVGEEECTISCTHVAGDYIGLVSADGPRFDLPSPEYITTIEPCKFIGIDRQVFHDKIRQAKKQCQDEITRFLENNPIFEKITDEDRNKMISQMAKQVRKKKLFSLTIMCNGNMV